MSRAGIVRSEHELQPLDIVCNALVPETIKPLEKFHRALQIVRRIERILHAILPRGCRHQLQQPRRAGPRMRVRLKPRFLKRLRSQQSPVPVDVVRILLQEIIVGAEFTGRRSKETTLYSLEIIATINEVLLVKLIE